jgi:hypothetical protein
MSRWYRIVVAIALLITAGYAYWKFAIPAHRIAIQSELIMLGDLDDDHRWTASDVRSAEHFASDPFGLPDSVVWRLDVNRNGLVDPEDLELLRALAASSGDPYAAEEHARAQGTPFPRPRELYAYLSVTEYKQRPLYALPYPQASGSVLDWLREWRPTPSTVTYAASLDAAIYNEAVRFDHGWRMRSADLLPIERDYAARKLARARALFAVGDRYELLLALIELAEDAETLTVKGQPPYTLQLLAFRDHLRDVLKSPLYAEFTAGRVPWKTVLRSVSADAQRDLGTTYDFETLAPPRNLSHLENYLQRAQWQYYKSSARQEDFLALISYAQHDARYLRAASRTSRKLQDPDVLNHNLPMVLLFREALRIEHGDKKRAVGLLDEAIRIPYAWIKSIPPDMLPPSLALDNFLLPGNKEDGADKSRHWNVFGGICLYKSPQEAVDLALKREMQDLRDGHYSAEAMREFFRDMIGDLNGMYEVMSVNPDLLTHRP